MRSRISLRRGRAALTGLAAMAALAAAALPSCAAAASPESSRHGYDAVYHVTNLVSSVPNAAAVTDPNLINPWGMSYSPTGAFWISDNNSGLSTLYDGTGQIIPLVVTIPGVPAGATGSPTGQVFDGSSDFVVTQGSITGPAVFIFDSEDGTISGWNPASTTAITAVDRSSTGAVDVFGPSFNYLGSFTDPDVPTGYAPFGIADIDGALVVTFAKQNAAKHDDVHGAHHGYVDVFSADGTLLRRLASGGPLDAPWGIALAPPKFGEFGKSLLIGNFGNGRINAFDFTNGDFEGPLRGASGHPIKIDGLWGLLFGNGAGAGPVDTLYFKAGPNHETGGLLGSITADKHDHD